MLIIDVTKAYDTDEEVKTKHDNTLNMKTKNSLSMNFIFQYTHIYTNTYI